MKLAMIVLDMQEKFYQRGGIYKETYDSSMEHINEAMTLFRKKNLPVVHVYHRDDESGFIPGSEGFEFHPEIKIEEQDKRVIKTYGNAFNRTGLMDILKNEGIDSVMITGFCAEYCVFATYCGARDLDLQPFLLNNGIAGGIKEHIRFVETICDTVSFGPLSLILK
ncbi:MAG: cysteine hydrolase [Desulfobacteraceae bacterium]|nr:cysteine hydrolase [Desulfobacteraceae bacterium]